MLGLLVSFVLGARLSGETLPAYPGTETVEVARGVRTPGQDFRFGFATVRIDAQAVARFFWEQWNRQGLPTIVERMPNQHWLVAAFDVLNGIQRTVIVAPETAGTAIFSAVANLWPVADSPEITAIPSETAISLNAVAWRDDSGESTQVESLIDGDLETAKDRINRSFEEAGYIPMREVRGPAQILLEHRGSERWTLSLLRQVENELTSVSQVFGERTQ
jgi:hypothetical protein